jgi:hypothetical protein
VVGLYRRLDNLNARMDTERKDTEKLLKNLVSVIDDLRGKLAERS